MKKSTSRYLLSILLILLIRTPKAEALKVEYGSIIALQSTNVIIEYSDIGNTKKGFICTYSSLTCIPTHKKYTTKHTKHRATSTPSLIHSRPTFKPNTNTLTYLDDTFIDTGTKIYYIGNHTDNPYIWSLYEYDLRTEHDILVANNVSHVDSIHQIGKYILFSRLERDGYGPELYNTKSKKLGSFRIPGINTTHATLSTENQRVVTIGTETGVLMEPSHMDTKQTYPLVIWLHGGPQRQTSYGWHPYHSYGTYDAILELLRKNNALILKLDYRGSFGFGKEYIESIRGSVGDGDVTDVMNALAYMKKQYNIGNTYLVGNSYGGYLSLRTIVEHPGSFSGAFSINGVTDWESLLARLKTSIFNIDFGGAPSADTMSAYKQASIIDRTSNLGNQKIAIVAGEADRTIPVSQSRMLYEDLLSKKKNVELVVYPGEDHVYKKKETISNLCEKIFSFMQITKDPSCDM